MAIIRDLATLVWQTVQLIGIALVWLLLVALKVLAVVLLGAVIGLIGAFIIGLFKGSPRP